MIIKKHYKIIIAFISIFTLGAISGAAIMPVIVSKVSGNPYSTNVLSDRIYNTHLLKNAGLTEDQQEALNELTAKYVLKYTAERDMFMAKRRTLYGEFKFDLNNILTESQWTNFVNKSDSIINEKEQYSKETENKWLKERTKNIDKKLKNKGYEKRLKYVEVHTPSNDIVPKYLENKKNDSEPFDFIDRYMIDRVKYNWDTYHIYHEVTYNNSPINDDMEP